MENITDEAWKFCEERRERIVISLRRRHGSTVGMWAEDIFSEAALSFVKHCVDKERAVWSTYFFRCVENKRIDRQREILGEMRKVSKRRVVSYDNPVLGRSEMNENPAMIDRRQEASMGSLPVLNDILLKVPKEYREVLATDMQGYTGKEGARRTGLTLPAYKSRLHRARVWCADYFGDPSLCIPHWKTEKAS